MVTMRRDLNTQTMSLATA